MYRVTQYDVNMLREKLKNVPEARPLIAYMDGFVDEMFYDGYGVLVEEIIKFMNEMNLEEVYKRGYEDGYGNGHDDGMDLAEKIFNSGDFE